MGFGQLFNSIRQIVENPYVPTGQGFAKHTHWQLRKAFNRFPFEQSLAGSRIVASHRNCAVSALINNQGLYDYNNMRLLQWLLRDGGTFFDIGANIGPYALVASEQQKAQVFAFEPHPATASLLSDNVRLNGRQNVTVCQMALGQSDGIIRLTDDAGSSENYAVAGNGAGTVAVPCRRGEAFCRERGVFPQYVKVDVEGFEFEVLLGFGAILSRVEFLLIECNGLADARSAGARAIHELLMAGGLRGPYRCNMKDRVLLAHAGLSREDAIYLREPVCKTLREHGWLVECCR